MKKLIALAALVALSACASAPTPGGPRMDWRCDGGAAFSARISGGGAAEVFAGGQTYTLAHAQSGLARATQTAASSIGSMAAKRRSRARMAGRTTIADGAKCAGILGSGRGDPRSR